MASSGDRGSRPQRSSCAALFLVLLLALSGVSDAAELFGYDTVVPPGARVQLAFQVWGGARVRVPRPGVEVEFSLGAQVIGRARSGIEGLAALTVMAPAQEGDYLVEGRAIGHSGAARLLLSVRSRAARLVVIDFERTIVDGGFFELLLRDPARVPPVAGAVAAVSDLAQDALVVYLVGHDVVFGPEVRRWLAHWGFARGVTIFGTEYIFVFARAAYKRAIYQVLAQNHTVAAGFGEDGDDVAAAVSVGAPAYLVGPRAAAGGAVAGAAFAPLPDWDALRAANARGAVPGLGWARALR